MNRLLKNSKSVFFKVAIIMMVGLLISADSQKVKATHISGADLCYRWISGNTFELTLTLYRDCSGLSAPANASIVYSSASCGVSLSATLFQKAGTGQEITHPCSASPSACQGGNGPGIQKFEYTGSITLPARCSDWVFGYSMCCRNCAITTLNFSPPNCAGAPALYVEARLNNLLAPSNSSPVFSNQPFAFLCIGQPFHYNHGTYESDGDSLSYAYIPARSQSGVNVSYAGSYSSINPISSSPQLTLSSDGKVTINPTSMEVGVIAIQISEFRDGEMIGSVIRDMQVYTQTCLNSLPQAGGINGSNNYSIVACPGQALQFTIQSFDPDSTQNLSMTWDAGIPGAIFSVSGTHRPTGTFNWMPDFSQASTQAYGFTVTVQDENCPLNGLQTFTYNILVPPLEVSVSTNNTLCSSATNGSATALPEGTPPFQYLWSPGGSTNQSAYGLTQGIYTVMVTDKYGCTATGTGSINAPAPLDASLISSSPVTCYNGNNGSAVIAASGGTPPYSYSWLPYGGTQATASGLTSGVYEITIRDANNCVYLLNVNIGQAPPINLSYSTVPAGCGLANGSASVNATGGTHPLTYSWNPGGTTSATISNIPAGLYEVKVVDAQNCELSASVAVSNTTGPSAQISTISHVSCYGRNDGHATVSISSGTAPFSYQWSVSGVSTPFISNLPAGNYSVTIVDSNNCVTALPVIINQPPSIVAYGNTTPASCYGNNDGQASVTVSGGSPPYTYVWSSGQNTQSISQLNGGSYTVTITDSNSCVNVISMYVGQPPALILHSISTPVLCFGGSDGVASVQCSGGTPGYIYAWSNGSNSRINTGLAAGTYSILVTDAQGCTETSTSIISEPVEINLAVTTHSATCYGVSNGSVNVNATGGTTPYTYNWSPTGSSGAHLTNLAPGNYTVTVSDLHACTVQQSISINSASEIQISFQIKDVSCYGGNDGAASISCSGGMPPYDYLWPDGGTGSHSDHLPQGNYSVEVSDQHACVVNKPFQISQPAPLSINFDSIHAICIGDSISLTANVSGGTLPYLYSWQNGFSGPTQIVNPQQTRAYIIDVRDVQGCEAGPDTILVFVHPQLNAIATAPDSICAGENAEISVNISGGNGGPYTYTWSSGQNSPAITVSPAQTSVYSVRVTDDCGTPALDRSFQIVVEPLPYASFLPESYSGCPPLLVPFHIQNQSQNRLSHQWNFGDGHYGSGENPAHTYTSAGQYTVSCITTNEHNCSSLALASNAVTIFSPPESDFTSNPELASMNSPFISFTNRSNNAVKYIWDFGDGAGTSFLKNPDYMYGDTGTYLVRLITESSESCRDTSYGTIRIKEEFAIYIPNAFTPNGDGVNDAFGPLFIGVKDIEMHIFDRWGQKIFHSSNTNINWSGNSDKNKELCQQGVYLYRILLHDLEGNLLTYTGRVNLIR